DNSADYACGFTVVSPGNKVHLLPHPSTSTWPIGREMVIGSEGRLGVITTAWVHVHALPENRDVIAYLFPNWAAGLAAMREVSTSDAHPSITRVSDAPETAFSMATRKESKGISGKVEGGLFEFLRRRGWDLDKVCISYIGYE